jgi:large subunit ribosomal protein L18
MATSDKVIKRQKVRYRLRKTLNGTASKPRLAVFRSNTEIYAQLINDVTGNTICAASSKDKEIAAQKVTKSEKSKLVGLAIAKKAVAIGIETCIFDRSGYIYHGRIASVADGAREGGIKL